MRKTAFVLVVLLLFGLIGPNVTLAMENKDTNAKESNEVVPGEEGLEEVLLFSTEIEGEVELYNDTEEQEIVILIPDDSAVTLLTEPSEDDQYAYIKYNPEENEADGHLESDTFYEGYVDIEYIVSLEDEEAFRKSREDASDSNVEEDTEEIEKPDKLEESKEPKESEETEKSEELKKPETDHADEEESGESSAEESEVAEEAKDTNTSKDDIDSEQDLHEENKEELEDELPQLKRNTISISNSINTESTSKLGHINSSKVKIYPDINDLSKSFTAGNKYTHYAYYIKKEAVVKEKTYYLIKSKQPNRGEIGWVKSTDMKVFAHTVVDKKDKEFYVKGTGSGYNTIWGGYKNKTYSNLSQYKGEKFNVHLTEKIGNKVWYRGNLDGKTVWIDPKHLTEPAKVKRTSKLGHINSSKVKIYPDINDLSKSFTAGNKYTHYAYYIKKEAVVKEKTYYLIKSKQPNRGEIGWVKSTDMKAFAHTVVDKKDKEFYVKGTGSGYNTIWGGYKNKTYSNLSKYKGEKFNVHLTEKIGDKVWYRGNLDGETVWIDPKHLTEPVKIQRTSKLGHINSSKVKIYPDINDLSTSIKAGSKYTNYAYYIKREAKVDGEFYYLIRSKKPNKVHGKPGWVKASDMKAFAHTVVDKKDKEFYVKGTGSGYNTIWGGYKNKTYSNLSQYKGEKFNVHLTEKIGEQTWYRGKLKGKTIWIHPNNLSTKPLKVTSKKTTLYNMTLKQMTDIQMKVNPQTDKQYPLWIREDALSIKGNKATVQGTNWNLRRGPGTNYLTHGRVNGGKVLTIRGSKKGTDNYTWYHVFNTSGWVTADKVDVIRQLNPLSHMNNFKSKLQFLNLSKRSSVSISEINNNVLRHKGILDGKAKSFLDAANRHGVNEIYLVSHALLETGNGSSDLATGVNYKGKTVYNMYGVGANDGCAITCGAKYAYEAGWFTPEDAIVGGAQFVSNNYLNRGQNTLYKMRWNPVAAAITGKASHQYATDIGWATKQTSKMNEIYNLLNGYEIVFDIPKYK